jgi:SNF2 family DNA or RNA helicase
MRGRIHRQPQQHTVQCYHLLANDTADILVSEMAQGKEGMMDAYLSKKTDQRGTSLD